MDDEEADEAVVSVEAIDEDDDEETEGEEPGLPADEEEGRSLSDWEGCGRYGEGAAGSCSGSEAALACGADVCIARDGACADGRVAAVDKVLPSTESTKGAAAAVQATVEWSEWAAEVCAAHARSLWRGVSADELCECRQLREERCARTDETDRSEQCGAG